MIDEDQQEEIAADAAQVFTLNQSTDEFITLMQDKWHNVPKYILGFVFRGIRAHSDLIKEGA